MAEVAENCDISEKADATEVGDDKLFPLPLPKLLCHDHEKCSDWKHDKNRAWYTNVCNVDEEITNLDPKSVTEWKYRNLYSLHNPDRHQTSSSTACRPAALADAMTRNTMAESTIEKKGSLNTLRYYLANYQESYGIPRTEYSFASLIKVMGNATGRSLLALIYIIVNITPVAEILLHILRFVLDKMINIRKTNDYRQMIVKYGILGLQLVCIYVWLVFIFGFIGMPILHMTIGIIAKIMRFA